MQPKSAGPYRLRKNSILPLVLKGHGFSRADKVNQISVGFSHRGTYFRIFGEIQPFSAACLAPEGLNSNKSAFFNRIPRGLKPIFRHCCNVRAEARTLQLKPVPFTRTLQWFKFGCPEETPPSFEASPAGALQ